MRILCLHGLGMNANVLQTQLEAPVTYELSKTHQLRFTFANGPVESLGVPGIAEQYEGPFYRFYDADAPQFARTAGIARKLSKNVSTPEDYVRKMQQQGLADVNPNNACDFIEQLAQQDQEEPFDGILGFSEGASAAASLLLRHSARRTTNPFKFAIFFCGAPPFQFSSRGIILADEQLDRINIPSAHIVGSKDPGHQGSLALYNLCNGGSATLYDHGKSHTIPWDSSATQGIANAIREVIRRSCHSGLDL